MLRSAQRDRRAVGVHGDILLQLQNHGRWIEAVRDQSALRPLAGFRHQPLSDRLSRRAERGRARYALAGLAGRLNQPSPAMRKEDRQAASGISANSPAGTMWRAGSGSLLLRFHNRAAAGV